MVKQRSVAIAIILSLITCGLYTLYWQYTLSEDLRELSRDYSLSGGMAILLGLITCGLYTLYWYYKIGRALRTAQETKGVFSSDQGVLFVILGVFGFGIISMAIAQAEINKLVD